MISLAPLLGYHVRVSLSYHQSHIKLRRDNLERRRDVRKQTTPSAFSISTPSKPEKISRPIIQREYNIDPISSLKNLTKHYNDCRDYYYISNINWTGGIFRLRVTRY